MKILIIIIFTFSSVISTYAQQFNIEGKVLDRKSNEPLSYTNIRVANTTMGTAANRNGEYELRLTPGHYKLIASYIGYNSDTVSVDLSQNVSGINFYLVQSNVNLPEVTVTPGENPALRIIREAIKRKAEREKKLLSYEFDAYTRGIIKTQKDISVGSNSVGLNIGNDTSALKITGILENESKGYFKKPDNYKEIIVARKQSSNFPSSINILTGGRIIQNFYNDNINFLGRDLPGPLADNALNYYYYYIKKILAIDHQMVYQIYMMPDDPSNPGFIGNIFITDSTFNMIKVDVALNRAANIGGLFDSVEVFQQFSEFPDSIYMPVDYRLFVTANFLNLAKVGFEINSILYDYKINPEIKNDFFNKVILSVTPDADSKDSTYWANAVTVPETKDEIAAYKRIDSLQSVPKSFWDNFSPLSTRINYSKYFSTSAPLGMYHFNRVEGNSLDFGFFLHHAVNQRLNSSLNFSYGFSDKKLKNDFGISYLLGDYRTYKFSFNAFNKLNILFGNSDDYNNLTATILSLLSKDDFRNYYYSNGFNFNFSGEVLPILSLNAGFLNHTDKNAFKNTEFSFFAKDRTYRLNPPIYETKINAVYLGLNFDFRDFIEDGFFRRRTSMGKSYFTFGGDINFSDKNFLKSDLNFTTCTVNARGIIHTFKSAEFNIKVFGMFTNGELPYQMLYSLPGNINLTAQHFTFRTLNINEILGDRVITVYIEHNFGDELFRMLDILLVKDWELQLNTYINIAYSNIGGGSNSISPYPIQTLKHPLIEAGFGIGQILFPLQLDFTWRLNYRGENNFRIGINSFIL